MTYAVVLLTAASCYVHALSPAQHESVADESQLRLAALLTQSAPAASTETSAASSPAEADTEIPALPRGLDESDAAQSPPLPTGLDNGAPDNSSQEQAKDPPSNGAANLFTDVHGFWETRFGLRLRQDAEQRSLSMAETRLQLRRDQSLGPMLLRINADLLYDEIQHDHDIDLANGRGWLDLRQAYFASPLGQHLDLRIGRQILTWGVGDLLFLNDLFPKDWNAFFIGRDVEYLKAPSDAVKLSAYTPLLNLDLVYTPRFDPDRFVDNRRLSLFDPRRGSVIGKQTDFTPDVPDRWFRDDEWAARMHRLLGSWEIAAYGYRGFWKSPSGFSLEQSDAPITASTPFFPRLNAWGLSLRGPLHSGILSLETARYISPQDADGSDPLLPNDQWRFVLGYEQELIPDLTLGLQYYLERTLDYSALLTTLPDGFAMTDRNRHLFTTRLTLLTHGQNVTWSMFVFASPSDNDLYLRAQWHWQMSDRWSTGLGANIFAGKRRSSFFGQFTSNSNVYASLRYGF